MWRHLYGRHVLSGEPYPLLQDFRRFFAHFGCGERVYFISDWVYGSDWIGTPPIRFCTGSSNNVTYPISGDLNQVGYYVSDTSAPAGAPKTMLKNDLLFGSAHPGIALFCNADASVQPMRDSVDFTVFQDLSTIAGGEASHADP
ncbi:MAG TPA: hypothetical protein VGM76_11900 [Lacipirellulaceae bacterium]